MEFRGYSAVSKLYQRFSLAGSVRLIWGWVFTGVMDFRTQFWGNQRIEIYDNFEGFPVNNNALFGARCHIMTPVLFLDLAVTQNWSPGDGPIFVDSGSWG